jgi:hypothetical protein
MGNHQYSYYVDFLDCPVCKMKHHHYSMSKISPISRVRQIYCEVCRVVRYQFRQGDGSWA